MEEKELLGLLELALKIIKNDCNKPGTPYVEVTLSNYGTNICFRVKDSGFITELPYDGIYEFDFDVPLSRRMYDSCKNHLQELSDRMKGFGEDEN